MVAGGGTAVHSGGVALTPDVDIRRNDQADWDGFDSDWYFKHNYASMRDDDRQILERMGEFFSANVVPSDTARFGLDVGPGTNLYPTFAMLPFCKTITLWERSKANIEWLKREKSSFRPSWDAFWGQLSGFRRIRAMGGNPRGRLAHSAMVCQGSIFNLPERRWDMGTMFFVAESITSDYDEFRQATTRFVRSLKPGAPFAAAFMEDSKGYTVGEYQYPAVPVTMAHIEDCLSGVTSGKPEIVPITSEHPLREGYSGKMLLALGLAG
jgi:hypothetical protein